MSWPITVLDCGADPPRSTVSCQVALPCARCTIAEEQSERTAEMKRADAAEAQLDRAREALEAAYTEGYGDGYADGRERSHMIDHRWSASAARAALADAGAGGEEQGAPAGASGPQASGATTAGAPPSTPPQEAELWCSRCDDFTPATPDGAARLLRCGRCGSLETEVKRYEPLSPPPPAAESAPPAWREPLPPLLGAAECAPVPRKLTPSPAEMIRAHRDAEPAPPADDEPGALDHLSDEDCRKQLEAIYEALDGHLDMVNVHPSGETDECSIAECVAAVVRELDEAPAAPPAGGGEAGRCHACDGTGWLSQGEADGECANCNGLNEVLGGRWREGVYVVDAVRAFAAEHEALARENAELRERVADWEDVFGVGADPDEVGRKFAHSLEKQADRIAALERVPRGTPRT